MTYGISPGVLQPSSWEAVIPQNPHRLKRPEIRRRPGGPREPVQLHERSGRSRLQRWETKRVRITSVRSDGVVTFRLAVGAEEVAV